MLFRSERDLACLSWPAFDKIPEPKAPAFRTPPLPIDGRDQATQAIATAQRNLALAPFAHSVKVESARLDSLRPSAPHGLVVCNPPYGKRLGQEMQARATAKELGRILRQRFQGWRAAILLPPQIAQSLGLSANATYPLSNGGLRVDLQVIIIK